MSTDQKSLILTECQITFDQVMKTLQEKNKDYSSVNEFSNFVNSSGLAGITVEKAILIRMCDKVARIKNLLSNEAMVKNETIEDTMNDLIGYTIILKAWRNFCIVEDYIQTKNSKK